MHTHEVTGVLVRPLMAMRALVRGLRLAELWVNVGRTDCEFSRARLTMIAKAMRKATRQTRHGDVQMMNFIVPHPDRT
jgi:hypothetical protein